MSDPPDASDPRRRPTWRRLLDHFAAGEPEAEDDPVERWGRRIGRALSLALCVTLGIYLFLTYVR